MPSVNIYRIVLVFCIVAQFCSFSSAEAASLINVPLNPDISDFNTETYNFIHRLLNKRVVSGISRGTLPYSRKQVVSLLLEVSQKLDRGEVTLSSNDQKRLKTLMSFYAEAGTEVPPNRRLHLLTLTDESTYRFSFDLRAEQRIITRLVDNVSGLPPVEGNMHITTLYPQLYGQVEESFAFTTDMAYRFLYGDIFDDLFKDESKYRQLEGQLKNRTAVNSYLKFKLPWFQMQLGQDNIQWGPGYHGNLMLAADPNAMDMLKLQATYKNVTYTAFTGILEDISVDINEKYISGHRIEGYFWNRFGIGLSEVVVFGNRFEPSYLNPVSIYLISEQTIARGDSRVPGSGDNILASVDLRLRPLNNFEIYGELMVDDGNPAASFKHWDTKFGVLGGIYLTDPFGLQDTDVNVEYAFVNQYAYTHVNPYNVYRHFTSVIGHHIGSDADSLWIEFRRRFTDKLETVFGYELERHGEGDVTLNHPPDAPADDVWIPLSGITETEHRLRLGFNWVNMGRYSIYGEWSRIWRRNVDNIADMNESGNEIEAKALYRF